MVMNFVLRTIQTIVLVYPPSCRVASSSEIIETFYYVVHNEVFQCHIPVVIAVTGSLNTPVPTLFTAATIILYSVSGSKLSMVAV